MITTLLKLIMSPVLKPLFRLFETRQSAKAQHQQMTADLHRQAMTSELEAGRLSARILHAEQQYFVTRMHRSLFIYPLGIWWSAVIADSLFHFKWDVAALPAPLNEWAGMMISSLFLIGFSERLLRIWRDR